MMGPGVRNSPDDETSRHLGNGLNGHTVGTLWKTRSVPNNPFLVVLAFSFFNVTESVVTQYYRSQMIKGPPNLINGTPGGDQFTLMISNRNVAPIVMPVLMQILQPDQGHLNDERSS